MTETGSPTVRRMLLGQQLRAYRQAADKPPEAAADHMGTTTRTVLRWEAGAANIRMRDLAALLDYYAVPAADRPGMLALAREARRPGWWTPFSAELKPTFKTFLGLEEGATAIAEYSAIAIPGLLQTARYMRAVMESAIPILPDKTIDARIEVRTKRQAEVQARGIPLHFVIDESCLMRRVGGPSVMQDQLQSLTDAAQSRLITIQILPFEIGSHVSMLGGFVLLDIEDMGPVACIELQGGDLYADGPDAGQYTEAFVKLREGALPQPHSLALMERIGKEFHHVS